MKNKIKNIIKILAVSAGCLMFASFSPSLDGRAVVVDKGVFPQGLFAKTVGYLPGDIISVTNIAGDQTIDLLVIGALDPSEGVAIMLSPEAADAMGIDKGANNIVKITKRSGQDERVYGNAVISKSAAEIEDWDDSNFENIGAEENTEAFDDSAATPLLAEIDEEDDFEEETVLDDEGAEEDEEAFDEEEAEDFEDEEAEKEEAFDEEEAEEEAEAEEEEAFDEELEEEAEDEEAVDEEEAFEEESEAEEFTDEAPEELEEAAEEEAFEADELNELPAEEETIEEEPDEEFAEEEAEAEAEEPEEESFEAEELSEEAPAEEGYDEEAFDAESLDELPAEESEELEEEAPAEEAFDEDELEALPEEEAEAEEPEEESDEYEAIVLVPVDSNPPESDSDSDEVEDVISDTDIDALDENINFSSSTINQSITNITPVSPAETKPAGNATSYEKYMVPSLNDLESGKYYIQIAVYGSDDNILDVINKYGANYPITIVPMAGGKTKQVLVGPVTMDEYKVVLERFKSYGFKDAFLRKAR